MLAHGSHRAKKIRPTRLRDVDNQRDGKRFDELMDQLYAVYREGYKCPDALKSGHWQSLKDVPFSEVEANARRLMATATKDAPFPRPASLRNRPAPVTDTAPSAAQEKAARDSIRRWRELKVRDPVTFEIEFRSSRAFTALAQCFEGDPDHDEWLREYRKWDRLRYIPRAEQESAVKQFLSGNSCSTQA